MSCVRPVIAGYDGLSCLGLDLEHQWARAARGESGIGLLTRFPVPEGSRVRVAGQVPPLELDSSPDFLSPRQMVQWTSPIFAYGMLTVHRALARAGIVITPEIAPRVGITFSSAVGGLDAVLAADRAIVRDGTAPMPCMNPNACVNMITGKIAMLTGATGPSVTTIAACATGTASMAIGALLLETGAADVVIAGAVDFPSWRPS